MEEKLSKGKYLIVTALITVVAVINFLVWQNAVIGIIAGVAYLGFYSFIAGSIVLAKKGWQVFLGGLLIVASLAILGGGFLYFYKFNDAVFILLLLLIPAGLFIPYYKTAIKNKFSLKEAFLAHADKFLERKEKKSSITFVFVYLTLAVIAFLMLLDGATSQSIQSPFQTVSPRFFLIYAIATAVLLTYLFLAKRTKLPLFLLVVHAFLTTGIALIVYSVGFGFDPFIHQAAEKIIAATGAITPKTLYYLGQYGIVLFLAKLTFLPIEIIDKSLVPIFASLTLPLTTYFVFHHWFKKNYALILGLAILIVPFTGLIMTTPQNLANLFFINTILLSLLYFQGEIKFSVLVILTLATLAIHPIAGIPLVITLTLLGLFKKMRDSYSQHLIIYFLTALVFVVILPLAFLANGSNFLLTLPDITRADLPLINLVEKFDLPLDLAYLFSFNAGWLAAIIIGIGIFFVAKHKMLKNHVPYLVSAFVIFADYVLIKYFLTFPALRDFDSSDFVRRISLLAFYILLPLFLIGLYVIIKSFWQKDVYTKGFIIFILTGLSLTALYLSYPQIDQYKPAKFFSLSESDIKATKLIEQTAAPEHIVLANQMIGVAAIKEFGFKKYYNGQFFYSMPNGENRSLYDYYLDMIYQDNQIETMYKAINEAEVDEAYFVLNQYWRDYEKIAQKVRQSAATVYSVDDGKVLIFKYSKN